MDARQVEGLQVGIVEAWPLAELAVPGLEVLRRRRIADDRVDAGADLLHLLVIGVLERGQHALARPLLLGQRQDALADAARQVGPAVLHQVLRRGPAGLVRREILQPALLPAWRGDGGEPAGIDRCIGADVDRRGRALEDVERLRRPREVRNALNGRGAGADDADALVGEPGHRRAERIAAGIGVVPAAGVEGMPGERLDARDAGQLGNMQRTGAEADELRGEDVAAVGADDPTRPAGVPGQVFDLGVEQGVVVEAEMPADAPAVRQDLRRMRVLLGRPMAGLLEQRHVDHRRRVALRAGIAVPVPGAAEIAALLDDAHVLHTGLDQARSGHQPGESATDEGEGDVIGLRGARLDRRVGIVEVAREHAGCLDILSIAVGPQTLVALLAVLAPQRFTVDRSGCCSGAVRRSHGSGLYSAGPDAASSSAQ